MTLGVGWDESTERKGKGILSYWVPVRFHTHIFHFQVFPINHPKSQRVLTPFYRKRNWELRRESNFSQGNRALKWEVNSKPKFLWVPSSFSCQYICCLWKDFQITDNLFNQFTSQCILFLSFSFFLFIFSKLSIFPSTFFLLARLPFFHLSSFLSYFTFTCISF